MSMNVYRSEQQFRAAHNSSAVKVGGKDAGKVKNYSIQQLKDMLKKGQTVTVAGKNISIKMLKWEGTIHKYDKKNFNDGSGQTAIKKGYQVIKGKGGDAIIKLPKRGKNECYSMDAIKDTLGKSKDPGAKKALDTIKWLESKGVPAYVILGPESKGGFMKYGSDGDSGYAKVMDKAMIIKLYGADLAKHPNGGNKPGRTGGAHSFKEERLEPGLGKERNGGYAIGDGGKLPPTFRNTPMGSGRMDDIGVALKGKFNENRSFKTKDGSMTVSYSAGREYNPAYRKSYTGFSMQIDTKIDGQNVRIYQRMVHGDNVIFYRKMPGGPLKSLQKYKAVRNEKYNRIDKKPLIGLSVSRNSSGDRVVVATGNSLDAKVYNKVLQANKHTSDYARDNDHFTIYADDINRQMKVEDNALSDSGMVNNVAMGTLRSRPPITSEVSVALNGVLTGQSSSGIARAQK